MKNVSINHATVVCRWTARLIGASLVFLITKMLQKWISKNLDKPRRKIYKPNHSVRF